MAFLGNLAKSYVMQKVMSKVGEKKGGLMGKGGQQQQGIGQSMQNAGVNPQMSKQMGPMDAPKRSMFDGLNKFGEGALRTAEGIGQFKQNVRGLPGEMIGRGLDAAQGKERNPNQYSPSAALKKQFTSTFEDLRKQRGF